MNLMQEIVAKVVYGLVVGSIEPQDVMIDVWDTISSEPRIQSDFLLMYHEYINWDIVSVHHCDFTDDEFEINVSHYSPKNLMEAKHQDELRKDIATNIRIDYKNSGLGSNACGPELLEKYRLKEKRIHFKFYIN